jgi:hypothetical protein
VERAGSSGDLECEGNGIAVWQNVLIILWRTSMEANEIRLIALVNRLTDAFYPNPDDPGPVGPWGPWIRDALKEEPFPQPWKEGPLPEPWRRAASTEDDDWWKNSPIGPHQGPPVRAILAALAGLSGLFDNELTVGGKRPHPNWHGGGLLGDLVSLNPQPLPPKDGGIGFARALANVALRRAREAGGEQGASLLHQFSEDWCGTVIRFPVPPKPDDPGEPRPPRPEESLVLGAALIRAASSIEVATLKHAAEEAGQRIFKYGLSGLA